MLFIIQIQIGVFTAQECTIGQQIGNVCFQYTNVERFHNVFIRTNLKSWKNILFIIQSC